MKNWFFGQIHSVQDALPPSAAEPQFNGSIQELLLVLLAISAVVLVLVVWVLFFRKRPDGKKGAEFLFGIPSGESSKRKRKRGAGRSPTRAETGGLPPIREEPPESDRPH